MARMGTLFLSTWNPHHRHDYKITDRGIVAEHQKGERERICIRGDYCECACGAGKFYPADPKLYTVPAKKIVENKC